MSRKQKRVARRLRGQLAKPHLLQWRCANSVQGMNRMPIKPSIFNMDSAAELGNPGNGLLSVKQAATYLNVSASYLYQSRIPHVRIGRRRLYRPSDLSDFIEQNLSQRLGRDDQ